MVAIKEIRETFTETRGNVYKTQKMGIRHQALLKEKLDQQCDSLISVKTDVVDFKESPSFTKKHVDKRFLNINEKVQNLEKELSSTKEDVGIIQTTEPTWALEIRRKLVDLEDGSRRNNLRILGIKENPRKSWEKCENKIIKT